MAVVRGVSNVGDMHNAYTTYANSIQDWGFFWLSVNQQDEASDPKFFD